MGMRRRNGWVDGRTGTGSGRLSGLGRMLWVMWMRAKRSE